MTHLTTPNKILSHALKTSYALNGGAGGAVRASGVLADKIHAHLPNVGLKPVEELRVALSHTYGYIDKCTMYSAIALGRAKGLFRMVGTALEKLP